MLAHTSYAKPVCIGGISLLSGTYSEIVSLILQQLQRSDKSSPWLLTYMNVANLYAMKQQPRLSSLIEGHFSVLLEGIGMTLRARLSGHHAVWGFNQTDLFPFAMREFEKRKVRVFCLGAEESVVEDAVSAMRAMWPGVEFCGHQNGYFESAQTDAVLEKIKNSDADILLVGMGFGRQELFSANHGKNFGVRVVWSVGGLFDFISGSKPRAPTILRKLHLEWLFRLLLEPRRIWRRIFVAGPWFVLQIVNDVLGDKSDKFR